MIRTMLAIVVVGSLAACGEAADIVGDVSDKGVYDGPPDAELDQATREALRRRIQGQNFN